MSLLGEFAGPMPTRASCFAVSCERFTKYLGQAFASRRSHRTRTRTNTLSFLDHSRSAYAATSNQDSAVFGVGASYGVIVRATVIARGDRHNVSKFVEFAHTPKGGNIH